MARKKIVKKKKTKQALYWLNHGCYPGTTMFIYNYSYDFVVQYLKKIKANDWLAAIEDSPTLQKPGQWVCTNTRIENFKTGAVKHLYVIRVAREFKFDDYDYSILAHEVLHLCQFFLPDLLDRDKEWEAEAYFHTHMMTQCLDVMRRTTGRMNKTK